MFSILQSMGVQLANCVLATNITNMVNNTVSGVPPTTVTLVKSNVASNLIIKALTNPNEVQKRVRFVIGGGADVVSAVIGTRPTLASQRDLTSAITASRGPIMDAVEEMSHSSLRSGFNLRDPGVAVVNTHLNTLSQNTESALSHMAEQQRNRLLGSYAMFSILWFGWRFVQRRMAPIYAATLLDNQPPSTVIELPEGITAEDLRDLLNKTVPVATTATISKGKKFFTSNQITCLIIVGVLVLGGVVIYKMKNDHERDMAKLRRQYSDL